MYPLVSVMRVYYNEKIVSYRRQITFVVCGGNETPNTGDETKKGERFCQIYFIKMLFSTWMNSNSTVQLVCSS